MYHLTSRGTLVKQNPNRHWEMILYQKTNYFGRQNTVFSWQSPVHSSELPVPIYWSSVLSLRYGSLVIDPQLLVLRYLSSVIGPHWLVLSHWTSVICRHLLIPINCSSVIVSQFWVLSDQSKLPVFCYQLSVTSPPLSVKSPKLTIYQFVSSP